jgi:hypothetical protein
MKIVYYESKYYDALLAFSLKLWPQKSEEYLKYRLFRLPESIEDNRNNLLVLNNEGEIVGCILYFVTKARINGNEQKVFWGHDFYVEEKYRGAASLRLMVEMGNIKPSFGAGSTDMNLKIQKELGAKFIAIEFHYVLFNLWSFKLPLIKLKLLRSSFRDNYNLPEEVRVNKCTFKMVSDVNDLNIPDNGYWNVSFLDIEFVRDKHFLKNRFFDNFNKYHFYRLSGENSSAPDECYFVVRPVTESSFPVLSLVDFRYNFNKPEQFRLILKAASQIALRNGIPLVSLRTSAELKKMTLYPLMLRTGSKQYIGGPSFGHNKPRVLVNCADADTDFLAV